MSRQLLLLLSAALLFPTAAVCAPDEFDAVTCAADIPQAVIGKRPGSGSAEALERKHQELELKLLGGDGDDETPFAMVFWMVCKKQLVMLIDRRTRRPVIADALLIPDALKDAPQSLPGSDCQRKGKRVEDDLFVLLDKDASGGRSSAKQAWRIDRKAMKFASAPVDDLSCARE